MIFFNHIPKTAGTTLQKFLVSGFKDAEILASYRGEFDSLQTSALSRREHGQVEYIFLRPACTLRDKRVILGHFGEAVRRLRFSDAISVVGLRDPVSRFKSAVMHHIRDPRAFRSLSVIKDHLVANRELTPAVLRQASFPLSTSAYLADNPAVLLHGEGCFETTSSSALDALDLYDCVYTDDFLNEVCTLFALVLARPLKKNPATVKHNTAAEHLPCDIVSFPELLPEMLHDALPEEFNIYEKAAAYARRSLTGDGYALARFAARLTSQSQQKLTHFYLDWRNPPDNLGWGPNRPVGVTAFEGVTGRVACEPKALIWINLQAGFYYALHATTWTSPAAHALVTVSVNGEQLQTAPFFPALPDGHTCLLYSTFSVPIRHRGASLITFALDSLFVNRTEFWLLDLRIEPLTDGASPIR